MNKTDDVGRTPEDLFIPTLDNSIHSLTVDWTSESLKTQTNKHLFEYFSSWKDIIHAGY